MSDIVNVLIDGKSCQAKEGEFILNVARANDIFIPALCYLTRCSPTLACRVCLVEADGKQVYSCNAKVKDGMNISTNTSNIVDERRAIMEVYDINHPLQCGVCDQSGECELQDYTMLMGVDKQNYAIKDINRPTTNWGVMNYDPGLCIVCEKCVTVCKDMIGSNALSTIKRDADPLDKTYKEVMPKDAYAMWNKLNKSLIGFEEDKCTNCGECIAVCPVGAMASADFQYTSNAWELTKVPASNPFSSDCGLIYYEVKGKSIAQSNTQEIYRVTNDSHYVSLSGATRFGFDYANQSTKKQSSFDKTIKAISSADTIKFNSYITNEEAMILQQLKNKLDIKLINNDALRYQTFLKNFSLTSGNSLYAGSLENIHKSDFVVSVGSMLKHDAPSVRYGFNNAITINKGAGIYFHPIVDKVVEQFGKKGKSIETIASKPNSEEAILYLLLDIFGENLPQDISKYLQQFKITKKIVVQETIKEKVKTIVKDETTGEEKEIEKLVPKVIEKELEIATTKLLDMIGANSSLLETIENMRAKKERYTLIIGEDCIRNQKAKNIAKLCGMIERYTKFDLVVIPPQTNSLGVALICDLDEEAGDKVIGYNEKADFQLSALGDGDIDMPTLLQQEGTFTNIDKRVVPTNAALPYDGWTLNDIANSFLPNESLTINYTSKLPTSKGFENIEFDKLSNFYGNDQNSYRGYTINSFKRKTQDSIDEITQDSLDEGVIYMANPIDQFNEFSHKSTKLTDKDGLYVSSEYLEKLELKDKEKVKIKANDIEVVVNIFEDKQISADIGYISTFTKNSTNKSLFTNSRYSKFDIKKA